MGAGPTTLAHRLQALHRGMMARLTAGDLADLREADAQALAPIGRPMLGVGDPAPGFRLTDQNGAVVRLSDRVAQGPVVLLFSRGGWCPFCTLQLRAWQDELPRLHEAGGDLLAVFPQRVEVCARTAERDLLAYPVLSDCGGCVADLYGVSTELPEVLRPLYTRLGHDLPRINGSGDWRLSLTSTFVVGRDGRIAFAHTDRALPDRLAPGPVIDVVRGLA